LINGEKLLKSHDVLYLTILGPGDWIEWHSSSISYVVRTCRRESRILVWHVTNTNTYRRLVWHVQCWHPGVLLDF